MSTEPSSSSRALPWARPRRLVVAAGLFVVVSGVAAAAAFGTGANGGRYRTATAEVRDVTQTMDEVGTIEPVSQVAVGFPAGGTVASVEVSTGDSVTVGQVLATLDPASLEADVRSAQAALDQAQLTLERALNGESVGGAGGGAPTGSGTVTLSSTESDTGIVLVADMQPAGSGDDELRAAQQAVLDRQRQVDEDLRAAEVALTRAQEICAALRDDSSVTAAVPDSTTTSTLASGGNAADACYDALAEVLAAQQVVQTSQNALADAANALDTLLAERAASSGATSSPAAPSGSPSAGSLSGDSQSTPTTGSASPSGSTADSPSSQDLIAYQKAVDEAELQVQVAQHAADHASIVSPISGSVVSVGLEPGATVEAGDEDATVVVAGNDGYEVTVTVGVDDLPDLGLGQSASVVPDGSADQLTGEVVAIGLVPTSGTSGTTYQVTIGLHDASSDLRNGGTASVAITTDEVSRVLTVPTSAVKVDNGRRLVSVLDGDETNTVEVEVGAVGSTWTEIRSGLEGGEVVVIADLSQALPGSATESGSASTGANGAPTGAPGGLRLRAGG